MNPGEIYLASFPFGGTVGAKVRPVLLLTGPVGPVPEVLVGYITSVVPTSLLPTDILLDPSQPSCKGTNLKTASILRLHKLATIHHSDLVRLLGGLSPIVWQEVEVKLRLLLKL
jgi:mRNA interferase MazF